MSAGDMVPLRELLDERAAAHEAIHQSERDALRLAVERVNERLEAMNEFRQQLDRERSTYVTRDVLQTQTDLTRTRIDAIQTRMENMDGRFQMLGVVFVVLTVAINVALRFI